VTAPAAAELRRRRPGLTVDTGAQPLRPANVPAVPQT
jgi:hypothetical protein